ncbi:MAG: hypothetical protein ACFWTQ_00255 [Lactococcus sp.]|jgi:hypothetical protein
MSNFNQNEFKVLTDGHLQEIFGGSADGIWIAIGSAVGSAYASIKNQNDYAAAQRKNGVVFVGWKC